MSARPLGEHIYRVNEAYFGQDSNGFPGIKNMFYVGAEADHVVWHHQYP